MLQSAKDLQNEAVKKLIDILPLEKSITFKAPTGSGKTFMMADFMHRVLQEDKNVVFILSSLSKGNLSEQNFKSIQRFAKSHFKNLKPYLITSETSGENALNIPLDYNVYILPRDLYKEKSKLKQGSFVAFLRELKGYAKNLSANAYREYQIYLIKDECHIATNNLDSLSKEYFSKVINFSATPKLERGQKANVEIKAEEAVATGLIKDVEYNEKASLEEALDKFLELKEKYQRIGIIPALIIQISNENKAEQELKEIKYYLSKGKFEHLKYMYIVNKEKDYDTNDIIKTKKLSPKKWKDFAKENHSLIDIIIFKMVISEGWDIPRACMLYQMRDSKSKQLDEQVIGRVRRNPCLLDYQTLDSKTRELISKAYVYGIKPKEDSSVRVFLKGFNTKDNQGLFNEIQKEFILNTTALNIQKPQAKNNNFVENALSNIKDKPTKTSIFELYGALQKQDENIKKECKSYTQEQGLQGWFRFNENLKSVVKEYEKVVQDYENSMEVVESNTCVLPIESIFSQTEYEKRAPFWIWQTQADSEKFCFDSQAEEEWFDFLYDEIREMEVKHNKGRLIKSIKISDKQIYLLGKNFVYQSELKFEYFFQGGIHASYPDFILKDWAERFHIFEVKSVNISRESKVDKNEYEDKIEALKQCYKATSKKLNYYFYIPIKKDKEWQIYCFCDGREENITKEMFKERLNA